MENKRLEFVPFMQLDGSWQQKFKLVFHNFDNLISTPMSSVFPGPFPSPSSDGFSSCKQFFIDVQKLITW